MELEILNEWCANKHENRTKELEESFSEYCKTVHDGFLCWGPTEVGDNFTQLCPSDVRGVASENYTQRMCLPGGIWHDPKTHQNISHSIEVCLSEELRDLIAMCHRVDCPTLTNNRYLRLTSKLHVASNCSPVMAAISAALCISEFKIIWTIIIGVVVETTRIIEWIGLIVSLKCLLISLTIFLYFRILRNNRTMIHINLFIATLLQVTIRVCIYSAETMDTNSIRVKYFCESINVILEFSKISCIVWMFIEGLYLHNAITVAMFQEYPHIKLYCWCGWCGSAALTLIWAIAMILFSKSQPNSCWFLYHFSDLYWILEGPSSALILINMLFLINIIRILVMKLRESQISEIKQMRKAVRAAIFLLPLMGTANVLFLVDYRLFQVTWKFATWSYVTHFLISFQGFFLSTLYCFCNGEVQEALRKRLPQNALRKMKFVKRNYSREETAMSMLDVEQ